MPQRTITSLLAALFLTIAPTAASAQPFSTSMEHFPYAGTLLDEDGLPVEGIFDVVVQVYEESGGTSVVAYQEFHGNVEVDDGRIVMVLGAGQTNSTMTLGELLASPGNYSVEFLVDGVPLGGPMPLGALPFAAYAGTVPASGVLVGGEHGLLPEAAIPRMVEVLRGWYAPGDLVSAPTGWDCEHLARIPDTSQATAVGSAGVHGQDIFVAAVGPVQVDVLPGLTVDFAVTPGDPAAPLPGEHLVQVRQAFTTCSFYSWTPSCTWDVVEPVSALAVEVESFCVPELAPDTP